MRFPNSSLPPLAALAISIIVIGSLLSSRPKSAPNSGFHEHTRERLRHISKTILIWQAQSHATCLPVVEGVAALRKSNKWVDLLTESVQSSKRVPNDLAAVDVQTTFGYKGRVFDHSEKGWKEIALFPTAVGAALRTGCIEVNATTATATPVIAMVPIWDEREEDGMLGMSSDKPVFGADLETALYRRIAERFKQLGFEYVHVLKSNGEIRAISLEELQNGGPVK